MNHTLNCFLIIITLAVSFHIAESSAHYDILVAGSLNLDTFLPLERLPKDGETITLIPGHDPKVDIPGGKGCNQAIACSKLSCDTSVSATAFVGKLGDDESSSILLNALKDHNVDVTHLKRCNRNIPSGRGYVFLQKNGKVSCVVSGGSNMNGWEEWQQYFEKDMSNANNDAGCSMKEYLSGLFQQSTPSSNRKKCLLLQREIPEFVNFILAHHAKNNSKNSDFIVLQDIGGEERPISSEMLSLCDFIIPNETELKRLVHSVLSENESKDDDIISSIDHISVTDHDIIIKLAKILQKKGANNVLVTLGEHGSLLVQKDGTTHFQKACKLPNDFSVVDETGAGDCYRAGFAVALSEGNKSIEDCMAFASAAGALAVTKHGAVPSIPSRTDVELLLKMQEVDANKPVTVPRGGASQTVENDIDNDDFPFMFGSRLNSMKDRPELWPNAVDNVRELVKRQGTIKGLGCVDFNYPQHFHSWTSIEAKAALDEVGLKAGAVCLRYPSKFSRGAMNHPDEHMRREAIEITKQAAEAARVLGCNEVVVWSAYDGYDYPFQVNYDEKWQQIVSAFQECCDEYPDIKWSLEYKPTDENTRFFTVPSTGAALLLVKEINRPNMGLTLDVGHMLMSGENPGHSIAMVGKKLFGIQLNDGYTRLAAEDGMMFGSIHPSIALEIMYQLHKVKFSGHLYFDTFPQRSCPVQEAEYNIEKVKEFWKAAIKLDQNGIQEVMNRHDAVAALRTIDHVMKNQ